jgi:hypothetical protein
VSGALADAEAVDDREIGDVRRNGAGVGEPTLECAAGGPA